MTLDRDEHWFNELLDLPSTWQVQQNSLPSALVSIEELRESLKHCGSDCWLLSVLHISQKFEILLNYADVRMETEFERRFVCTAQVLDRNKNGRAISSTTAVNIIMAWPESILGLVACIQSAIVLITHCNSDLS
jgi:hypothetical protein